MSTKLANITNEVGKEKLMQDLRVVVGDAEELLQQPDRRAKKWP